jgi:hypothetical protein
MSYKNVVIHDKTTGKVMGVDGLGHAGIVPHAHENGGHILFEKLISATADFILIDISDTASYPHDSTNWLHTANIVLEVDATADADYDIQLGFLENVNATDGDFHEIFEVDGSRQAGNDHSIQIAQAPEAPKLRSESFLGPVMLNQIAFQTDVNLISTKDPSTADTPSGNGDMAMRITVSAGSFKLGVLVGYHSH